MRHRFFTSACRIPSVAPPLENPFHTFSTAYLHVGVLRMTYMDVGNATGLSGAIPAHAPAAYSPSVQRRSQTSSTLASCFVLPTASLQSCPPRYCLQGCRHLGFVWNRNPEGHPCNAVLGLPVLHGIRPSVAKKKAAGESSPAAF